MEENPQPEVTAQPTGVEETQPVEQPAAAVLETPAEPTQDTPVEEPTPVDNSNDWLSKKGIDPNDPEAFAKVTAMAQNAEKAMHAKAQKASQLEKEMSGVDVNAESQALARAQAVENRLAVRDFFDRNPEAKALEQEMADYITGDPVRKELVKQGFITLDEVHAIVSASGSHTQAVKEQTRKETLEGLANKQRATSVQGAATTSTPAPQLTPANADQWWQSIGPEGRANPENRAKMDSLLS